MKLTDVALPVPVDRLFTYKLPVELEDKVRRGCRVIVPFGKKILTGIALRFPQQTTVQNLKFVTDVIDSQPFVSDELLKLVEWMAEYYLAPVGETMHLLFPPGFVKSSKRFIRLKEGCETLLPSIRNQRQQKIFDLLRTEKNLSVSDLQKKLNFKSVNAAIVEMEKIGLVEIYEQRAEPKGKPKYEQAIVFTDSGKEIVSLSLPEFQTKYSLSEKHLILLQRLHDRIEVNPDGIGLRTFIKSARTTTPTIKAIEAKGLISIIKRMVIRQPFEMEITPPPKFELTPDQTFAINEITKAIESGSFKTFLIHGITGSGKTQVYIEAIRKTLAINKTAIVLVPEISLTPQTVSRFRSHFGDLVAVLHSRMSDGERYDSWQLLKTGSKKIAIGPRSALFAPLTSLGLIIVDEEHESSYKQFDAMPRYNARDVAIMHAQLNNAVAVLGSATPSLESYYNTVGGKYELLNLPERVDNAKLPVISIVNMINEQQRIFTEIKKEVKESGKPFPAQLPHPSISKLLKDHIDLRFEKNEGIILFQNRRGYAHISECVECGFIEKCSRCDVSLTYHLMKKHLRCHYCGFVKHPASTCPGCGGINIRLLSFGTQQIQEELQELFPGKSILRMDMDTTSRKGSHSRILTKFGSGESSILLGTQMVAKGLDFPHVTLVGVVSADTQLGLPDFRAAERTFQLLTQVAGRAGRANLVGEVIIQTFHPEHYAIGHATTHDFTGFYEEEIKHREQLKFPPFSRLVLVEFSFREEGKLSLYTKIFADLLRTHVSAGFFEILGPADAPIPKIRNKFRKQILIKNMKTSDPTGAKLRALLRNSGDQFFKNNQIPKTLLMSIDVDPQGMM
jgi:primosomal protein N' (replication factor Y)